MCLEAGVGVTMLRVKTIVKERVVSDEEAGKIISKFVSKEESKRTKELDMSHSDQALIGRSDRVADDVIQKLSMTAMSLQGSRSPS